MEICGNAHTAASPHIGKWTGADLTILALPPSVCSITQRATVALQKGSIDWTGPLVST